LEEIGSTSERPEFLADVLGSAIADIERNAHALTQAIAAKDFELIRNTAHALKGVCSSVGATRLETMANRLLRSSAEELVQHAARLNADIIETSRHSVAALRSAMPGRAVNG
jgi:HPt (histidine-containing phosphotransfer) domain-containing protein